MAETGAGSVVSIATTYASAVNMTAVTNAAEAVATLAAGHGVLVGDYIELTSGWGRLNGRIVRAKAVASNDVTLEGIDTTSTTKYPAGSGTGTVRRITAWTTIPQIKRDSFSISGGEQNYTDATPLESEVDIELPTTRAKYGVTFAVMDTSAGLTAARAADTTPTAFRVAKGSKVSVGNMIWTVSEIPSISGSEVTTFRVDGSFTSLPKSY